MVGVADYNKDKCAGPRSKHIDTTAERKRRLYVPMAFIEGFCGDVF